MNIKTTDIISNTIFMAEKHRAPERPVRYSIYFTKIFFTTPFV